MKGKSLKDPILRRIFDCIFLFDAFFTESNFFMTFFETLTLWHFFHGILCLFSLPKNYQTRYMYYVLAAAQEQIYSLFSFSVCITWFFLDLMQIGSSVEFYQISVSFPHSNKIYCEICFKTNVIRIS